MTAVFCNHNAYQPLGEVRDGTTTNVQKFQNMLERRQLVRGVTKDQSRKDHDEGDEVASLAATAEPDANLTSLSAGSKKVDSSQLNEHPETQKRRSRERSDLVKALENFRKVESEKVKHLNTRNPSFSTLACSRKVSNSASCGETGGSRRRTTVSRSKHVENEKVLYTNSNGEIQSATILKVHWGNHNPVYDIRLHISGEEKQTDDAHLTDLPINESSKSRNRAKRMSRQSSSTSLQSIEGCSSTSSQTTRRPRLAGRRNGVTLRKGVSTRSLSKGRKSRSASSEPSGLPNSTWDRGTRKSSLPKRRATSADKLHRPDGDSTFLPSKSSKSPEREDNLRSFYSTQRSRSLQSMVSQDNTRRKPLRRTKSIDHAGLVFSLRHVDQNTVSTARQLQNIRPCRSFMIPKQGLMKKPSLSRAQSCRTISNEGFAPRGEHLAPETIGLPSLHKPAITAQVLLGNNRASSSCSHPNVDGMVTSSAYKKRPKAFLAWKKAKSMSSLLPRQHM